MKSYKTEAVSPVVGVMMMLVVTIIIAAVVSAFAGSSVSGQEKAPQATIQGKFSIQTGMEITHMGGDALATNDLVFTVRNSKVFGPNLEQRTAQVLNKTHIMDRKNQPLDRGDGSTNVTALRSGDTFYITAVNCTCSTLQPIVASTDSSLCFANSDNVGKTFYLDVSDKSGNLISRSEVTISP
ncbi:MAG: type IV pilin N-terminal domain-containing protein [Methanoregula sp.]|jgi:FlaG/FlaF family flagellin (archaellin)